MFPKKVCYHLQIIKSSLVNLFFVSRDKLLIVKKPFMYFIAVGVNKGMPFLLVPFLTRYLTVEEYGYLGIASVVVGLLTIIIGLNPSLFIITNFSRLKQKDIANYIYHSLLIIAGMFVFVGVIMGILAGFLKKEYGLGLDMLIVLAGTASAFVISALVLTVIQMLKKAFLFLKFSLTSAGLQLGFVFIMVIWIIGGWKGKIVADLLAFGIIGLILLRYLRHRSYVSKGFSWPKMRYLLSFSLPLLPHTLSLWTMNFADRFFLAEMVDIEVVGIYTVAYYIGLGIMLIHDSMQRAWQPYFFEALNKKDKSLKIKIVKYTWMYYLGCIMLFFLYVWAVSLLMPYLMGEDFNTAITFIPMIVLGYTFHGMYRAVAGYLYHINRTGLLASVTMISAILNIALNYILISRNGAIGAAQATALTFLFNFVVVKILAMRYYKMPWFTFFSRKKN